MKKVLFSIGCLVMMLVGTGWTQNNFCGTTNNCMRNGEELRFKVFYNLNFIWVGAGEAKFTVQQKLFNNIPVYHIVGVGSTYSSYDWIFKVRDRYETYVDTHTMLPVKFLRDVNEGSYKFTNDVTFDRQNNIAQSKSKIIPIPDCVQDILSSIYYARNIEYDKFKVGEKFPFKLFLDDEVYDIYIRYLGKETIKTKYGTFKAIKISPLLIKGTIFEGGEKMMIWVSDDKNKIPLRVDSPILVGSIKVDMISYQNLRFPLNSLIKKD